MAARLQELSSPTHLRAFASLHSMPLVALHQQLTERVVRYVAEQRPELLVARPPLAACAPTTRQ